MFDRLISFYIAIADGTGCVERGLGRHAAFLESHVGGPDNDMAEACLEIAVEGPGEEQDVFQKSGEVFLFTSVSRSWAQFWRTLYGRRFACYKEMKSKGRRNTGMRLAGSFKAVAARQATATGTLMRMARAAKDEDQPTVVPGLSRLSLVRGACRIAGSPAGKRLEDFRKTTERKRAAKTKVSAWAGFGAAPIKFRRKTGTATSRMIAAPHTCSAAQHPVLQASRWMRRWAPQTAAGPAASQGSSGSKRSLTS